VKPTAASARIDAVTMPKPMVGSNRFMTLQSAEATVLPYVVGNRVVCGCYHKQAAKTPVRETIVAQRGRSRA